MLIVPTQAVPAQSLNITLNGQSVTLDLYAAGADERIFVNTYVNGALILGGTFGNIGVRLIRDLYLGFEGDFVFNDTMPAPVLGPEQVQWEGLGQRWQMLYLFPAELTGSV
jgi:hypothetical protein